MNKVESFLSKNPGYLKWGKEKLAMHLKVSVEEVIKARKRFVRTEEPKDTRKSNVKHITVDLQGLHVVFPDIHVPGQNEPFIKAALKLIKDLDNVVGLHIIGDFLNMSSISRHEKGRMPKGASLMEEYKQGNKLMDTILAAKDFKVKTFIWGNHEDWFKREMNDPDFVKLGLPTPTEALNLKERGFQVIEDWKQGVVTLGDYLDLCHGEYVSTHTAKKHIDVYRRSVMFGHSHRAQTYIEGQVGGYNIGSMIDTTSECFDYATRAMKTSWVNQFALVYVDEDGYYHPEIITWYNNRLYYGGKKYE
jgi:predicted phosphodiesterase